MSEFDLIRTLLDAAPAGCRRKDVALGPGDDAALLVPPEGQLLATTTDTLIAGRHFPLDTDPEAIGHKSLAVNLSDLAAMGAEPAWLSLSLSLPEPDSDWVMAFAKGFYALAVQYGAALVGGDITRGSLSISITAMGFVPADTALQRSAARPGDDLYVSGHLGGAALALERLEQGGEHSRRALDWPQPRCELGLALRGLARAGIDLSDGLAADAGHIAKASAVALEVDVRALPMAPELADCEEQKRWSLALTGGDDYELLFTAAADQRERLAELADSLALPLTRVGRVRRGEGVNLSLGDGHFLSFDQLGYNHFQQV